MIADQINGSMYSVGSIIVSNSQPEKKLADEVGKEEVKGDWSALLWDSAPPWRSGLLVRSHSDTGRKCLKHVR